ncbi:response regulator [Mariprofundus erugo]|uniref:Response regulator n=1 Tax=Mariprofundus erugo TaxID=2528639 RepID=A0A5R9GYD1_9PROT|nr:response regulator [Mariprofundus erugo]TLS67974.1 response regulator [Mariprofundus erugo]TLS74889.1 response regulator [Mariprofundus erugo]
MAKVLLVDDDDLLRCILTEVMISQGYEVIEAADGRPVADMIIREEPDILITDLIMPEQEGLKTIQQARALRPQLPIIAISGGGRTVSTDFLQVALIMGVNATLTKPFDHNQLVALVDQFTGKAKAA